MVRPDSERTSTVLAREGWGSPCSSSAVQARRYSWTAPKAAPASSSYTWATPPPVAKRAVILRLADSARFHASPSLPSIASNSANSGPASGASHLYDPPSDRTPSLDPLLFHLCDKRRPKNPEALSPP